jgi:hypothetical protein
MAEKGHHGKLLLIRSDFKAAHLISTDSGAAFLDLAAVVTGKPKVRGPNFSRAA